MIIIYLWLLGFTLLLEAVDLTKATVDYGVITLADFTPDSGTRPHPKKQPETNTIMVKNEKNPTFFNVFGRV